MSIVAIIQARTNSSRLPNKIFAPIEGKPLIWHIVNRVKKSRLIGEIIIATTTNKQDDIVEVWARENNVEVYRGSEENVLERFYLACEKTKPDVVVRITSDDPFKDPEIIDFAIELLLNEKLHFVYNNKPASFPEGLDTEVFTFEALKQAYESSVDLFEQEHVTQYFYRNPNLIKQKNFAFHKNIAHLRWTIDEDKDLQMAMTVYQYLFNKKEIFLTNDILELLAEKPWIQEINSGVKRSIMYKMEVPVGKNK